MPLFLLHTNIPFSTTVKFFDSPSAIVNLFSHCILPNVNIHLPFLDIKCYTNITDKYNFTMNKITITRNIENY